MHFTFDPTTTTAAADVATVFCFFVVAFQAQHGEWSAHAVNQKIDSVESAIELVLEICLIAGG